jgi:cytidylate kinase
MEIKNGGIMMKIITISREFGSGGRELGKRLADALGIPCYDHEIMDMVAEKYGFDKNYISHVSEKDIRVFYPTTIAHRLIAPHPMTQQSVSIAVSEHQLIQELAQQGDCVIVGRSADIVLREMNPMNIFVYADWQSKLNRCKNRADGSEHFSEKEILKKMKQIDKERAAYRSLFCEKDWGKKESYHLCINTSGKEIKALIPAVADYVRLWFGQE